MKAKKEKSYVFPTINLLNPIEMNRGLAEDDIKIKKVTLDALNSIGIDDVEFEEISVLNIYYTSIYFSVNLPKGKKKSDVLKLSNKIAFDLNKNSVIVQNVRDNKYTVQVPNKFFECEKLVNFINNQTFNSVDSNCIAFFGHNDKYEVIDKDFNKIPNLLITGASKSGKTNLMNVMIASLLYRSTPIDARLILIDLHKSLVNFKGIPNLLVDVISSKEKAIKTFEWLKLLFNSRCKLFEETSSRNIDDYNSKSQEKLEKVVVFVEDLFEIIENDDKTLNLIYELLRLSRSVGIYYVFDLCCDDYSKLKPGFLDSFSAIATFYLPSSEDSKAILDNIDATKLSKCGDILLKIQNVDYVERIAVPYISNDEIIRVQSFLKENNEISFNDSLNDYLLGLNENMSTTERILAQVEEPKDLCKVLKLAIELAKDNQILAISTIQRKLGFGWPKAAKLFDILDELGYLEPINPKSSKRCTATDETLEQFKSILKIED